jgi:antitoxin (DNA-binding transcriptional repressor) of toxin-antitoxin stability system
MKKASITDAKNNFSALLKWVRQGETVIITDRDVPVAQLAKPVKFSISDEETLLARLEVQGVLSKAKKKAPLKEIIRTSPPRLKSGVDIVEVLLSERQEGR